METDNEQASRSSNAPVDEVASLLRSEVYASSLCDKMEPAHADPNSDPLTAALVGIETQILHWTPNVTRSIKMRTLESAGVSTSTPRQNLSQAAAHPIPPRRTLRNLMCKVQAVLQRETCYVPGFQKQTQAIEELKPFEDGFRAGEPFY